MDDNIPLYTLISTDDLKDNQGFNTAIIGKINNINEKMNNITLIGNNSKIIKINNFNNITNSKIKLNDFIEVRGIPTSSDTITIIEFTILPNYDNKFCYETFDNSIKLLNKIHK